MFVDAQKVIWSSEILSGLVAASFKEDKYGVVQMTNLADVLSTLLTLNLCLDKLYRNPLSGVSSITSLRTTLRHVAKSSLYNITVVFRQKILSTPGLNLTPEQERKLNSYLEMKEV